MKNLFALLGLAILLAGTTQALHAQEEEYGMSSYYHDDFQGRETAYGVVYDKNQLTAAHKKHPFGTILRVTRLDNQRSVDVKVTDKGPFIKGRVVDLSRAAAERLGLIREGSAEVRVDVISYPDGRPVVANTTTTRTRPAVVEPAPERPEAYEETPPVLPRSTTENKVAEKAPAKEVEKAAAAPKETRAREVSPEQVSATPSRMALVGKDYAKYDLYHIELRRPAKAGFGVQIAHFTTYENVLKEVADLQAKWFDNILVSVEPRTDNKTSYKLILGPFASEAAAQNYEKNLKKKYKINGFTVNLENLSYKAGK